MSTNRFPSLRVTTETSNQSTSKSITTPAGSRTRNAYPLLLCLLLFSLLASANGQVSYLPPIGGDGGGQFDSPCGAKENLMGFELRAGDFIDAIRPVCVVTYGPRAVSEPHLTAGSGLIPENAPFGTPQVMAPGWFGGPGGRIVRVLCPASTPIVIGMFVRAEGVHTVSVSQIHLFCGQAIAAQKPAANPSAVFDAKNIQIDCGAFECTDVQRASNTQTCPAGQVAVGVHGRAGKWLDSMGLICDAPRRDTSGLALGRVQTNTSGPVTPICDAARSARARNSPAAASLEAQCNASKPAPVGLGRVGTPAQTSDPVPICDAAQSARARNSPAAPSLEAQCKATGGQVLPIGPTPDQLAVTGKILSNADPLAAELRKRQPVAYQRGFDIGMAASEGQTLWGPGKEKLLNSLNAGDQQGFKVAVSFTLDRNRNAKLATTGAAIAKTDPLVAQARIADLDVRSWLGFDIASGLFGDPAKGAQGNTAVGPGSTSIRNALSLPAQRGFDSSMKLHFSRKYTARK